MDLTVLLEPTMNLPRLETVLDGLGHAGRLATVHGWERKTLARLFEAAKGHHALGLEHFVPAAVGPMTEVIHHGKNSLPLFSHFQKRFTRPEGAESPPKELWGFNRQANEGFTGPGYFVVHTAFDGGQVEGEVAIDYRKAPGGKVAAWPEVIPNEAKLGRFVYAGMVDVMRGVSSHVSIGRAWKHGKWMDAWFALCREDVS
jgi:hypothetical protein